MKRNKHSIFTISFMLVIMLLANAFTQIHASAGGDTVASNSESNLSGDAVASDSESNLSGDANASDDGGRQTVTYQLSEAGAGTLISAEMDSSSGGKVGQMLQGIATEEMTQDIYACNGKRMENYPLTMKYYQSSSRYSTYEGASFCVDGTTIVITIPFNISDSMMTKAYLQFEGNELECTFLEVAGEPGTSEDLPAIYEDGSVNLQKPLLLQVTDTISGEITEYEIVIKRMALDLPVLYLTTDSGEDVTSRYEYVTGSITIDNSCHMTVQNGSNYEKMWGAYDDAHSQPPTSCISDYSRQLWEEQFYYTTDTSMGISIRGRGNASWWKFPQKSYMIKFDEPISLFGMTSARKYALISTYGDLSLVRNCVAMDIASQLDRLEYTPGQIPVDVFLNGEYLGIYTLSEKIDIGSTKVDLFSEGDYASIFPNSVSANAAVDATISPEITGGDTTESAEITGGDAAESASNNEENEFADVPFMLECGGYVMDSYTSGLDYFYANMAPQLFFKYPLFEERYDPTEQYIEQYMNQVARSITRGNYEEYIDVDSWVDWFIVMELTNNTDSALCRSTYLYKRADGKLMLGPVWDFDMAFGNFVYDNQTYEYWATAEAIYIMAQGHYMTYLYNSDAFMTAVAQRWDEVKEDLLQASFDAIDRYGEQVSASRSYNSIVRGSYSTSYQLTAMRNFIQHRYNWIDMSLHTPGFNRNPATQSVPVNEPEDIPLMDDGNALPAGFNDGNGNIFQTDENGNLVLDENGNPILIYHYDPNATGDNPDATLDAGAEAGAVTGAEAGAVAGAEAGAVAGAEAGAVAGVEG